MRQTVTRTCARSILRPLESGEYLRICVSFQSSAEKAVEKRRSCPFGGFDQPATSPANFAKKACGVVGEIMMKLLLGGPLEWVYERRNDARVRTTCYPHSNSRILFPLECPGEFLFSLSYAQRWCAIHTLSCNVYSPGSGCACKNLEMNPNHQQTDWPHHARHSVNLHCNGSVSEKGRLAKVRQQRPSSRQFVSGDEWRSSEERLCCVLCDWLRVILIVALSRAVVN